jgi:phytoene dehydrogenase-like protein
MGGVTQALAAFAISRGVQIRTEAPVIGVKLQNGRATGVVLPSGEEIDGTIIVSGVDPKLTFLKLVGDQLFWMRPVAGWARYRTPIQGLYLCASGSHPGGGVMGAPGHNAAREILRELRAS